MSSFPGSPRSLKGGIVLLDPETSAVQRIIALQYHLDKMMRKLEPRAVNSPAEMKIMTTWRI